MASRFNYYAVTKGHQEGIFSTWEDTDPQVNGYRGNRYKGYANLKDAILAMQRAGIPEPILYGPGLIQINILNNSSHDSRNGDQLSCSQISLISNTSSMTALLEDKFDEDITFKKVFVSEPHDDSVADNLETEDFVHHTFMSTYEHDMSDISNDDSNHLLSHTFIENNEENVIPNEANATSINTLTKPITSSCGCQTDIQFGVDSFNEILDRLSERDEVIESLRIELNSIKCQLKNEIKAQVKPSLEENQLSNTLLADVKKSNDNLKSQLSDQKSMIKDLLKSCHALESRSKDLEKDLEYVKCSIKSASSSINDLHHVMSSEKQEPENNDLIKPDQTSQNSQTSYNNSTMDLSRSLQDDDIDHDKSESHDYENNETPSPRDKLFSLNLNSDEFKNTDIFVIGDSQISLINAYKMKHYGKNESVSKISVPGITPEDLFYWLGKQPSQPNVKEVIVHIGANSCLKGVTVKQEHWDKIIRYTKKVFPNANLIMSTIIPVGSKDNLYDSILDSIKNLKSAASVYDVTVVDHTDTFLTRNNAPILELFRKRLHPNLSGTIKMALKLKYPYKDSQQNRYHSFKRDNDNYDGSTYSKGNSVPLKQSWSFSSRSNDAITEYEDTSRYQRSTNHFNEQYHLDDGKGISSTITNSKKQDAMTAIQKFSEFLLSLM